MPFNVEEFNARTPPPLLYFYARTGDWLHKFFADPFLRFSNPRTFNDPFEFRPLVHVRGSKAEIESLLRDFDIDPKLPPDRYTALLSDIVHNHTINTYRVRCFTEDPLHPLMWAHYAASHEGVCIGVDSDITVPLRRGTTRAGAVQYHDSRPLLHLPIADKVKESSEATRAFFSKGPDWSSEKEWRIVVSPKSDGDDPDHHAIHLSPKLVRVVIVGARASQTTYRMIRDAVDANRLLKHVELLRAVLRPDTIGLELRRRDRSRFDLNWFIEDFRRRRAIARSRGDLWYSEIFKGDPELRRRVESPDPIVPLAD